MDIKNDKDQGQVTRCILGGENGSLAIEINRTFRHIQGTQGDTEVYTVSILFDKWTKENRLVSEYLRFETALDAAKALQTDLYELVKKHSNRINIEVTKKKESC